MADQLLSGDSSSASKYKTTRKKYALGGDVDKETVFDFPYLLDEETVSYIEEQGHAMIIIRGPPGTGKATLSEMITERYPDAAFCCADKYFDSSFETRMRNRDTIKVSHIFCEKKASEACESNKSTIIVQNTHMRKWEMQPYLDLAARYNYTVIMAITLYRFDVTPKSLFANNTDGLNFQYFYNRLRQWVDVPPLFTGWFLCPQDASFLLNQILSSLKGLLGDGKFCRVFNLYSTDDIIRHYQPRRLLASVAGYTKSCEEMKNYYLSDIVQDSYGKCFDITIPGYVVSPDGIVGIVSVNVDMKNIIFVGQPKSEQDSLSESMGSFELSNNILEHSTTVPFEDKDAIDSATATFQDWNEGEKIDVKNCTFLQVAQKDEGVFNVKKIRQEFREVMDSVPDSVEYTELDSGTLVYRLPNDQWLVKADKKISFKTLFTGLYV